MSVSLKELRKSGLGASAIGRVAKAVVESLESRTLLSNAGLSAWAPGGASYALAVGTSSDLVITPAAVVVSIPDANLEAAIRSALSIPTGDITDVNMATLNTLDASSRGVANLTSLEFATSLQSLNLSGNQVTDVTPLSGLTQLAALDLSNNQIPDVTPLSGMTQMVSLNLSGNQITDISPLMGMTLLSTVDVSLNNLDLSDGSPASMVIQGLTTQGTTVTSLPQNTAVGVVSIPDPNLEAAIRSTLAIPTGDITDTDMATLTSFAAPSSGITDLTGLESATNLQSLDLSGNQITDVTPLAGLTQLTSLDLSNNQISDVSSLGGLTAMAVVDVSHNNIDTSDGSPSMTVIQGWTDQGATVTSEPQNTVPVTNEAPTDIALDNDTIATGLPAGTIVGTFSTTDPNPDDTFTYTLVGGEGSTDNASFVIVGDELQTATSLDAAVQNSYSIRVQTMDQGGLSTEKTFVVNVTTGEANLLGEFGLVGGKKNQSLKVQDVDGDTVTFTLANGGTGQVFGSGGVIDQVVLTGTTAKSAMTAKVKMATGGDGAVTIGGLTSDGLIKSIEAGPVIVTGPVDLNTLNQAPGKTAVALQFQQLHDAGINSRNLPISSLKMLDSQNTDDSSDVIAAPSIGSITVSGRKEKPKTLAIEFLPGELADSVMTPGGIKSIKAGRITGDIRAGQDAKGKGIGSITSTGIVSGSTIATSGSVNTVKVGALIGTDILVGVAPDFDGRFATEPASFVNATAKLNSLTVTGAKLANGTAHPPYVVNSNISAPNVGTITLLNVPAGTGPMVFVLNDKGTLKINQTKLVSEPMVAKGTFKAPKTHSPLWQVVTAEVV